jgi:hypothetical protein
MKLPKPLKNKGTVLVPTPETAGGYNSHPMHSSKAPGLSNPVMSHNGDHMPSNSITPQPLNMHFQNTIASQRMMVKECVKTTLFRRLKFFKKDVHGLFDVRNDYRKLQCQCGRSQSRVVGRYAQISGGDTHRST